MTASFDIGIVGLGVMGENLALNFVRHGFAVAGFDADAHRRDAFDHRTRRERALAATTLARMIQALRPPRRVLVMVPAGAAVDAVVDELKRLLAPGDVILDGGNTHFLDTQRRMLSLEGTGILFVGAGVSGGEEGALRGPALMPGGDAHAWPIVRDVLRSICARAEDGEPCCDWIGPGGAGHFVKMVHNGIEYADMQTICEAYALMRDGLGQSPAAISQVFARWNEGELASYLIGITSEILARVDGDTGQPLVDVILDTAEQKGTGKWASQVALDLGVTAPTIAQAVFARTVSANRDERLVAADRLAGPSRVPVNEPDAVIEKIRRALLAAKVCAYAQGFALIRAANAEYQWDVSMRTVASVWRAGCIIRARLLEDMRDAFAREAALPNLLLDARFTALLAECQRDLRDVVALAATQGVAVPAFMSALAYYDAYRTKRLPANLLQAQRDYFGAHKYQRVDREGRFHTEWNV